MIACDAASRLEAFAELDREGPLPTSRNSAHVKPVQVAWREL